MSSDKKKWTVYDGKNDPAFIVGARGKLVLIDVPN
jgi:hypothetical protein